MLRKVCVALFVFLVLGAFKPLTVKAQEPMLNVTSSCSYAGGDGVMGRHIDISIDATNLLIKEGAWTVITEVSTGKIAYFSWQSEGGEYSDVTIHKYVGNVRGPAYEIVSGREYLVQIWKGPYTIAIPSLTELITESSVVAAFCYDYHVYLPMVSN